MSGFSLPPGKAIHSLYRRRSLHKLKGNMEENDGKKTIDQPLESSQSLKHGNQNIQDLNEISDNDKNASTVKDNILQLTLKSLSNDNIKEGKLLGDIHNLAEESSIKLEKILTPEQPKEVNPEIIEIVKHDDPVEGQVSFEEDQDISKANEIETENLLGDKHDLAGSVYEHLFLNHKPDEPKEERKERKESVKHDGSSEGRVSFEKDHYEKLYDKVSRKRHWILGALGRLLGLEYAPINIPISRRLETFGVTFWMSTFLCMGFGSLSLLVYLFCFTQYWWVSLCYFTWYLGDRSICDRGGRRLEWVRNWALWKHMANFFPVRLIKTVELDPSRNYIMGYHPHGVLSAGAFVNFAAEGSGFSKIFPGLSPHLLTLAGHFHLPFYREFFLSSGAVSATRESMDYLLGREGSGRALCLVVGGAKESLDCHPGQVILHLNKRKGFCKMALRHGTPLVPMFSFGENDIYDQIHNPEGSLVRRIQNSIQKVMGLAPCVFLGRGVFQYSFGIVPYRHPIYTVVGAPIEVPHTQYPTKEQIVDLHSKYVEGVKELYNKYKHKYAADPTVEIQIV